MIIYLSVREPEKEKERTKKTDSEKKHNHESKENDEACAQLAEISSPRTPLPF